MLGWKCWRYKNTKVQVSRGAGIFGRTTLEPKIIFWVNKIPKIEQDRQNRQR